MTEFTQRVLAVLRGIPPGYVLTYGDVAARSGQPRAARQVARILHSMSRKHHLPWHRIVDARGRIVLKDPAAHLRQKHLLASEGVRFADDGSVDLKTCRFV